jgi:PAS domain S-box-containing protein
MIASLKDKITFLRNPRAGALLGAALMLILLLVVWEQATRWYQTQLLAELRAEGREEVSLRGEALSAALNRRFTLVDGLQAFAQTEAVGEDLSSNFELFATGLYASIQGIDLIALAPDGIIKYVYPLQGNQDLLGYNLLADPRLEVREDVQQAIDTHEIILSGPRELAHRGAGLVTYQAIFQNEKYWGLGSIAIDLPILLEMAGLETQAGDFEYALRDNAGRTFLGSTETFERDPVIYKIRFPEDYWEFAGVPQVGWRAAIRKDLLFFQIAGLIILGLTTSLTYLLINRQSRLSQAVQQRTREIDQINLNLHIDILRREIVEAALREQEEQYRSIFESTTDGLFINDLDGNLVDFNPAASRMHGYTVEEFRQLQPSQFIHQDSMPVFEDYLATVRSEREFRGQAVDICKDGSLINVEVFGTLFSFKGKLHALAVVRNITDELHAYRLLEKRVEERTGELSALLEVAQSVGSTLELKPLLALILNRLKEVIEFTGAGIATLDGEDFVFLDYQGPTSKEQVLRLRIPLSEARGYREVYNRREAVIYGDIWYETLGLVDNLDEGDDDLKLNFGYARSWMGVPLIAKDRIIGVLRVDHQDSDRFTEEDARLVMAFSNQAAVAIENARLYEQAQSLASLKERQKLARELHDSVSQALYGIALGARTAMTLLDRETENPQELRDPLEYVVSLSDAALVEMRALIFELRPESLETEGLVIALTKRAVALSSRYDVIVNTDFCEEPHIPLEKKEAIYRVAQEAMNNTIKHANATEIQLVLRQEAEWLVLDVRDNGRGFDPELEYSGHLGLRSMSERLEQQGGNFEIESTPGEGTIIRAHFPI